MGTGQAIYIKKGVHILTAIRDGNNKVDKEDLVQSGYLALLDAVRMYKPEAGCSFIGYLNLRLKTQFMIEAGIRTSRRDALAMARSLEEPISARRNNERKSIIADIIPSPNDEIEEAIDRIEIERLINTVHICMERLAPRERDILTQIYIKQKNHQVIAEDYKITAQRVGQIRNRAIRLLRKMPEIRKIRQEKLIDMHTSFYKHKGYDAFNTSFSSVVEDLIIWRERQKEVREVMTLRII